VAADPDETSILAARVDACQRRRACDRVLQFASLFLVCVMRIHQNRPFGFSPKISTPVENTVEKHRVTAELLQKTLLLLALLRGEA
jgi:hypothetical protein